MFPFYLYCFLCSFFVPHALGLHISIFALYPACTTYNLYGSTTLQPHYQLVLSQCVYVVHFYSLQFYNFILYNVMTYYNLILTKFYVLQYTTLHSFVPKHIYIYKPFNAELLIKTSRSEPFKN
jgi:hypothetical protein